MFVISAQTTWLVETVSLNQACKAILLYSSRRLFAWILDRFFGTTTLHFGSVVESLSFVCVFLLSSLRFHIVVSDGASISFWKILWAKFKVTSGWAYGHENLKIWSKNWNLFEKHVVSQITPETEFREGLRRQNPPGSCSARNIQDFGGATCMFHGLCSWAWCMECCKWICILAREWALVTLELLYYGL